jgi:DNA polymerase III epsilon subunit-like protein
LLDAQILADVYLAMTGGQTALHFEGPAVARPETTPTGPNSGEQTHSMARSPLVVPANENELVAHRDWLRRLGVETLEGES